MEKIILEDIRKNFTDAIRKEFEGAVNTFILEEFQNRETVRFSIGFRFYNFFYLKFHFNDGEVYFSIFKDEDTPEIRLKNTQKYYANLDMEKFLNELQEEIEVRLPDSYLEHEDWIE